MVKHANLNKLIAGASLALFAFSGCRTVSENSGTNLKPATAQESTENHKSKSVLYYVTLPIRYATLPIAVTLELLNDIAGNLPPLGCDAVRVGATYSTYRRDHSEGGDILREWDNRDMDRYDRRGFNSR